MCLGGGEPQQQRQQQRNVPPPAAPAAAKKTLRRGRTGRSSILTSASGTKDEKTAKTAILGG